jgi:rhodanese-related sulfurtransferase
MTFYSDSGYSSIGEISVEELAKRLGELDESLQFIDVRESHEIDMAYIKGFTVLPLSQFREWEEKVKTNFNPQAETIVMCHHGMRSAQMCQWLLTIGFTNVKNVLGGIDAYSVVVDPSIPRY